jgi:predicted AAA+ superfamily ATPase
MIDFPQDKRKWTIFHKIAHSNPRIGAQLLVVLEDYKQEKSEIRQSFTDVELIHHFMRSYPVIVELSTVSGWQNFLKKVRNGKVEITTRATAKNSSREAGKAPTGRRGAKAK